MAEKDTTARLRRAVKENNLFLVKRLVQRTDQRNPDPGPRRHTSLAWAAVLGHEETFDFLLHNGHDDHELSRDSDNNYILMLLADRKPSSSDPNDSMGSVMRMARLYYDRYPDTLDWQNAQGKTALHFASQRGNEELVRIFCDWGAEIDLADYKGNTALHFASSWGFISVVQLLIERGCQYTARNNQGFTASDYAYSFATRDTLQDTARLQFENNKRSRRAVFTQAAVRGGELSNSAPVNIPTPPVRELEHTNGIIGSIRMRSGSGTSRATGTTGASDIGDIDGSSWVISGSPSSSPSQPSAGSGSHFPASMGHGHSFSQTSNSSVLSPYATRVRERDADAMEKFMRRNRSESQGTASTENRSQNGSFSSAGPSANGDDITSLTPLGGAATPRRLRPSISASQLRPQPAPIVSPTSQHPEARSRSGTNPTASGPETLARSSSTSTSASLSKRPPDDSRSYTGPPSQYATFPEPPFPDGEDAAATPIASRRMAYHPGSRNLPQLSDHLAASLSHRRGLSSTSVRGS